MQLSPGARKGYVAGRRIAAQLLSRAAVNGPPVRSASGFSPIFLLGCGRSGTTIVGRMLGTHSSVLYLNEPRYLWRVIDPRTDVWRPDRVANAQLALGADDATPEIGERAVRGFHRALALSRRDVVIEKLPANSFRIGYLQALFPRARFVILRRHGLEVATSMAATNAWYGSTSFDRWAAIRTQAVGHGIDEVFLDRCTTDVEKGLVEWTIATTNLDRLVLEAPQMNDAALLGELDFSAARRTPLAELGPILDRAIAPGVSAHPKWRRRAVSLVEPAASRSSELTWPAQVHEQTRRCLERHGYAAP